MRRSLAAFLDPFPSSSFSLRLFTSVMVLLTSLALSSAFGLAVAAPATKTTSVNAAEAEQRCSALAQTNLKGVKPYMTKLYPGE